MDLNNAYLASVASMTLVASTHDIETGQHLIRTKKYIKVLAKKLFEKKLYKDIIDKHYIDLLYEAAPLHDIGKVGIPDSILKKPDKLTFDEFEVMKTHTQLGGNILQESLANYEHNPLLEVAYNIAMYHHEKWDGTGYPKGLKGDAIPLEAQLMSLADIYDALVSKRRYKRSLSFEEAEEIIEAQRETAFNPLLIDVFLELKEKFKEISLEWSDE
jgi:adenylate cyclase